MSELTIHRGSHQIGGCCTEISAGGHRILIDFGANLPGTDGDAQTKDREMVQKVFGSRQEVEVVDELPDTAWGQGGIGSTGR